MIRHTRNVLMLVLGIAVAVSLVAVVLYESDTLPVGVLSGRGAASVSLQDSGCKAHFGRRIAALGYDTNVDVVSAYGGQHLIILYIHERGLRIYGHNFAAQSVLCAAYYGTL